MIQRIQTLYLLLSSLLLGAMFLLPLGHTVQDGTVSRIMVWGGYDDPAASSSPVVNSMTLAASVLLGATLALGVITIFRYKKRKLQKRLCSVQVILLLIAILVLAAYLKTLGDGNFGEMALWVTAAFPPVSIVLVLLARRGIAKDDKLVRSLDRIR